MTSLFSFAKNAISLGYPIVEAIFNCLPLADEVVLVDCGSTDGTKELLESLTINPLIKLYHDTWENGTGGKAVNKSGDLCHKYCSNDTIVFIEADEVWQEGLVNTTRQLLDRGQKHLKFWRFQLTQNFQRSSWYLEPGQLLARVFPRGSCQMDEANTTKANEATAVGIDSGYIIDCRNNFRDLYLARDKALKELYGETTTNIRMVPAHANYNWNMTPEQIALELEDQRWRWTTTPFKIPRILEWHLGKTTYEVRPELVTYIKNWIP